MPVVIVTNGIGQVQRGRMAGSEIRPYIERTGHQRRNRRGEAEPADAGKRDGATRVTDRRRALMLGDSLTSDYGGGPGTRRLTPAGSTRKGAANDRGVPIAYEIASLDEVDAILTEQEE